MSQKTSWPELVGLSGEEAKAHIEKEFAGRVDLFGEDMMGTSDVDRNRVRVHVKGGTTRVVNGRFVTVGGIVKETPAIG